MIVDFGSNNVPEKPPLDVVLPLMGQGGPDEIAQKVADFVEAHNSSSLPGAGGLTAKQVFMLNHYGWWANPPPVRLDNTIPFESLRAIPLFHNAQLLLQEAVEAKGAPLTVTKNLKRAFVARLLDRLCMPKSERESIRRVCKVINESDVFTLHVARIVCQAGGLLRPRKGRLVVSRRAKALLAEDKAGGLYAALFDALFCKINLAYFDRLSADAPGVQATFPFVLFRLGQMQIGKDYGIEKLSHDVFLPTVREEMGGGSKHIDAPAWILRSRILSPLSWMGLVEFIPTPGEKRSLLVAERVKKRPLFDAFIGFDV